MSHRPRVATVLSSSDWESNFSTLATTSSMIRLIARFEQDPVDDQRMDVIIVGSDTPWLSAEVIRRWRARGTAVIGICRPEDKPGLELLRQADEVRSSTVDPESLLHLARLLGIREADQPAGPGRRSWYVTGPHGSPGRTEVAIALAAATANSTPTYLIDADLANAGVSIRLGVAPRPNICSLANLALASVTQTAGKVHLVAGALGCCSPTPTAIEAACRAALDATGTVIMDSQAWSSRSQVPCGATPLFVCQATPDGIIRAAQALKHWDTAPPLLVVNRVTDTKLISAVRGATGLEPSLLIPESPSVHLEAVACQRAAPTLVSTISTWLASYSESSPYLSPQLPQAG